MSLGGGQGAASGAQQPHATELAALASSAARRSMANGAPPPQVPQLLLMSQTAPSSLHPQHQQQAPGGAPHSSTPQHRVAIAEARVLAQEAAHLQAQAKNFKACLPAPSPFPLRLAVLTVNGHLPPIVYTALYSMSCLDVYTKEQCNLSECPFRICAGACGSSAL